MWSASILGKAAIRRRFASWNIAGPSVITSLAAHPARGALRRRHLARLPLHLSYPAQVQEVARLLARPPCRLTLRACDRRDRGWQSGRRSVRHRRAQSDPGQHHRGHRADPAWSAQLARCQSKSSISILDARLHVGELRFAASLTEASAMQNELEDFRRKVSTAGRYSYEARVGKHDDLGAWRLRSRLWAVVGRPQNADCCLRDFPNMLLKERANGCNQLRKL